MTDVINLLTSIAPVELANFTRDDLPALLAKLQLNRGVEVGVYRAWYSYRLCRANPNLTYYGIDPWLPISKRDQTRMEHHYQCSLDRLAQFGDRAQLIRKTSAAAAPDFADNSLDFVYLDADHSYDATLSDLNLWVPKVRTGGIIAGHDYDPYDTSEHHQWRVGEAVEDYLRTVTPRPLLFIFGRRQGVDRYDNCPRSFMWVK